MCYGFKNNKHPTLSTPLSSQLFLSFCIVHLGRDIFHITGEFPHWHVHNLAPKCDNMTPCQVVSPSLDTFSGGGSNMNMGGTGETKYLG